MKRLSLALMILLAVIAPAVAGPLKQADVPATAKWVAHLDVGGTQASKTGQWLLAQARKDPKFNAGIAQAQRIFGVDLLKDIHGITLYGEDYGKDNGVVVINATVNQGQLLELLRGNPSYASLVHGGHTIHKWLDEKKDKVQYGTFHGNSHVVIAPSKELMIRAIDVLNGWAESLGAADLLSVPGGDGALLVAAAEGFPIDEKTAVLFRDVTRVALEVGETKGTFRARLALTTRTPEHATRFRQMAQGLVAFAKTVQGHKNLAFLQGQGETMTIGGDETSAKVEVTIPAESLTRVLELLRQMEEEKKKAEAEAAAAAEEGP